MRDLHIIIAEDDLDDGELMFESFNKHPQFEKVEWVRNGMELLTLLNNSGPKPDVILTDINMPIMGGIEVLEEICADETLNRIPTFVYSSTRNPLYEKKCVDLGTKGFLIKPMSLQEFEDIPDKIIEVLGLG